MTANKTLLALTALGSILLTSGQRPALAADLVTGTPVQTIHSKFGDPQIDPATNPYWFKNDPINYDSPDGSDIVYLGTNPSTAPTAGVSYRNTLLLCDGEVDEMTEALWAKQSSPSGFSGFNLFEMSMTGTLLNTFSTTNSTRTGWSNEPVGCSFNPHNGHLFISDDDQRLVFEINPGSDGELFTADDSRTSFSTSAFKNNDPEGLAYNPVDGALYIVNGADSEIHKLTPGANGRFDGIPPVGDDVETHFDTLSKGVEDPEGIAFDADNRLYVVGKPQTRMAHIYTSGPLIRTVDISAFNFPAGPRKPAGLAVGPSGTVFISARNADNNVDPNENDGTVHEVSVPDLGAPPPAVAAGPDLTVFMPNSAQLNGAAVNTGSTTWSQFSGPGTVTFGAPTQAVTTANFNEEGLYVLRLSDNSSTAYDEATIQVRRPSAGFGTIYVSPRLSTKVPVNPDDPNSAKLSVANEDIIAYDTVTRTWSTVFEGKDVGLGDTGVNVDGFKVMADGSILLSLDVPVTLPITDPSMGTVVSTVIDDSDIVRFVPTSLGDITAGSFQWFFDGSDVGLDTDSEDIDAIGFLPSGKLVVSLTGSGSVPGVSTAQDEDLIAFTASDLGADTVGTWNMHFDGSDVGLSDGGDSEDVMGAWIDSNNAANSDSSNIYLSTKGDFSVPGATGDGADIFKCSPSSIGTTTACSYVFNWDGGGNGIAVGAVLDGIDLVPSQPDSDTTSPTVSLTAPAANATVSGTVTVSADAADNVGVAGVQFQIDGNPLGAEITGSGPYELAWDTSVSGVYSLTAVARDAAGNTATSGSITITVDNAPPPDTLPPSVSLTAPAAGATISGIVTISVDAADNVGVAGVQFQLDGNPLGAEITGAGPYSFAWDTDTTTGGHSLTAVARDAAGNTATSGSITVSVDKGVPADTTLPSVTLTAPAAGASVSGTVTVSADATDNVGVAGVQFQLDGNPLGAEITGAGPYSFAWDTASAVPGGHNLTAVARDAAGNTATSGSI
ncbi:MAG: Ig-like domain-containing protein, partial [Methylobacter sp.]